MSKAHKSRPDDLRPAKTKLSNVRDNKAVAFNKNHLPVWTVIKKEKGKALLNANESGISRRFPLSKEVYAL